MPQRKMYKQETSRLREQAAIFEKCYVFLEIIIIKFRHRSCNFTIFQFQSRNIVKFYFRSRNFIKPLSFLRLRSRN